MANIFGQNIVVHQSEGLENLIEATSILKLIPLAQASISYLASLDIMFLKMPLKNQKQSKLEGNMTPIMTSKISSKTQFHDYEISFFS